MSTTTNKKQGLAPLMCPEPRILILGSLPSDESIRQQEYYGNPKNLFWKVLAGVYGSPVPETYPEKKTFLAKHHIALWDVYASAEREGSLDSNIKEPERNDVLGLIRAHPTIQNVVLNGGKAASAFKRLRKLDKQAYYAVNVFEFTSTSPMSASAGWNLERIIEQWKGMERFTPSFPFDLRPRIHGIEAVLRILGANYDFHDSEVEEINIRRDGEVTIRIWSGWATWEDGEFMTEWTLHNCVEVNIPQVEPYLCFMQELDIEADRQWLVFILDGIGSEFSCESIDVRIYRKTGE